MPQYSFKTLYFPAERTRAGKPARVTISIPTPKGTQKADDIFIHRLSVLSGRQIMSLLGDPVIEDIEAAAQAEGRSLSNCVINALLKRGDDGVPALVHEKHDVHQLEFSFADHDLNPPAGERAYGVTFRESHRRPLHGWYPYVEGFSANYVEDVLLRYGQKPRNVYDPFGGAGTTQLAASALGIPSFYAELNPFMVFVAKAKTDSAAWARSHLDEFTKAAHSFIHDITQANFADRCRHIDLSDYHAAFPGRDFFVESDLRLLLGARDLAERISTYVHIQQLLLLACAANTVAVSNMTRRADLRRRRSDEYKTRVVDVPGYISRTVCQMIADVLHLPETPAPATFLCHDAKEMPRDFADHFAMAITSPPYLNGTNYFRNTKLELWLLKLIKAEADLQAFRTRAVCGGINDVTGQRPKPCHFAAVEAVAKKLDSATKDRRIPAMVRYYFSDMADVFSATFSGLQAGGRFVMDIGDSCFYGVHVPTDQLLIDVAKESGFVLEDQHVLAKRYSKDRTQLRQLELVFSKPKKASRNTPVHSSHNTLSRAINEFGAELPYLDLPYTKRNWGHPLHSLCSYQGKLKPAIAYWLVKRFVPPGEAVLDPLGGVGTIPFEAALAGHPAVSSDKSPLAATIAAGKLCPPTMAQAGTCIDRLAEMMANIHLSKTDIDAAEFGLNAAVKDYYHRDTLCEVLKARRVFLGRTDWESPFMFVWAGLLHILHGNRPYALSRRSHPITPFNPTGPTSYHSLLDKLRDRVARALKTPMPAPFRSGESVQSDFREFPARHIGTFGAVITSPPFMGMRFDRPNWLRLWFCGWSESSFHNASLGFLERQQVADIGCYIDFFSTIDKVLKPSGIVIIHVGSGDKDKMHEELISLGRQHFQFVGAAAEDVSKVEKHGIKDKGRTTSHHFLFFRKE